MCVCVSDKALFWFNAWRLIFLHIHHYTLPLWRCLTFASPDTTVLSESVVKLVDVKHWLARFHVLTIGVSKPEVVTDTTNEGTVRRLFDLKKF
ncbi:hypothetical protein L5515_008668 [Caenorhabditis briggsae]|uniref:Uncharacterized protein n=1 Tax=Caenorhabditis briggsae TaxID=6238 RepID=A0AAE9JMQ3_CAEBR|nr:hypothetical protein L3Y34_008830 [Caenorhabditis briggsae]UMM36560.1 hypothetical protein L5515_008668 [Caenorhabditis briggsae]